MNLQEALDQSGIAEAARKQAQIEQQAAELARKERLARLTPTQRWWQNFRMPMTQFEIVVFIKVQADSWMEAVQFLAKRNLNKTTTRCKTREDAIDQLRSKILAWEAETQFKPGETPPAGSLLYWRIYDQVKK